jgi:hypothetical protein
MTFYRISDFERKKSSPSACRFFCDPFFIAFLFMLETSSFQVRVFELSCDPFIWTTPGKKNPSGSLHTNVWLLFTYEVLILVLICLFGVLVIFYDFKLFLQISLSSSYTKSKFFSTFEVLNILF